MGLISLAVWTLTAAVAAGTILALWHLRAADGMGRPPLAAGIAHAIAGTAGLIALVFALGGPARGVGAGVGSFGLMAAWLFAGAVVTGIATLLWRRKPIAMAVHAGVAITGYVLLLAWNALG